LLVKRLVNTISDLVEEVNFFLGPAAVYVQAVQEVQAAAMHLTLKKNTFEKYDIYSENASF